VEEIKSKPLIIAHRGASGLAPENTLAAFRLAIALGADGVEMDVQLSADRRAVVLHDARVNRTTNGAGRVTNLTLDDLRRLDAGSWFDRRLTIRPRVRAMVERALSVNNGDGVSFSGEKIPTLEQTLALLARSGLRRVYVELKCGRTNRESLLEAVVSLVREYRMEQAATLLSFDHAIIGEAKRLAPEIRAAVTFPVAGPRLATQRTIISSVERASADEAALHFSLATRRTVEALRERGISVSAWTANRRLVMRRLINCGVDSIMTNFPNRLSHMLERPRA
jgi:glycerophosphoryl diester phosphodiesterase